LMSSCINGCLRHIFSLCYYIPGLVADAEIHFLFTYVKQFKKYFFICLPVSKVIRDIQCMNKNQALLHNPQICP
jgi:hypothetical protein